MKWIKENQIWLAGSLMVALMALAGCGKKTPPAPPPPPPPPPATNGQFGGGGGACGNVGQVSGPVSQQPISFWVGSRNSLTLNLQYVDPYVPGAGQYRVVGSGQFDFQDLKQILQNQAQITQMCLSSSSANGSQPIRGWWVQSTGQIALRLMGTISTSYISPYGSPYAPNGQNPQGQMVVTMDLGSQPGCSARIINGEIQGCALVTLGDSQPNGQNSIQYQVSGSINPGFGQAPYGQQQQQPYSPYGYQQQPYDPWYGGY